MVLKGRRGEAVPLRARRVAERPPGESEARALLLEVSPKVAEMERNLMAQSFERSSWAL